MTSYTEPFAQPPEHDPVPGWGQSLSAGAAGIALLHAAHAHAGLADWATADRWVGAMIREPVAAHADASLFQGAPAVAFTLRAIQRQPGRDVYAGPLAALDRHIAALTRGRLERAHERIDRGQLPELREFDLINGLTGIGVYLLHAEHTEVLRDVLAYLVRLVDPVSVDGQRLPGWWSGNGPADQPAPAWPGGHANLGIAHGIAGPLALLALALRQGVGVPGQLDAIDRVDAWLEDWRCGTPSRPWWPGMISRAEHATGIVDQPGPQRPSWCYGTPGLARSRQLAALALTDQRRQRHAEHDLASCLADDTQLAHLRDDSLCHGWAGLVHTTWRASLDAEADSDLVQAVPYLHDRWNHHRDQHAMLEGAAGIALAHHALATTTTSGEKGEPITTAWDACLLTTPPSPQPRHDHAHLEGIG
jgi:hypothetical protein